MRSQTVPHKVLVSFRCSDAGVKTCDWEGTAEDSELLMFQVEQHALNQHNMVLEERGKAKIRAAIKLTQ
jgi:predicted small metal-binding protein